MIFPENIGGYLSIDELSLSRGELYTFVTNKSGKGKKGTLAAVIKGTKAEDIKNVLEKIPIQMRETVKEITLDMAKNIESGVKKAFPKSQFVTDRFHVIQLGIEAMQHIRIKQRWKELEKENKEISLSRERKEKYQYKIFENGDTPKQLLARSRYVLTKLPNQWTENQAQRAAILFREYPQIQIAYEHLFEFRNIYENKNYREAKEAFLRWIKKTFDNKIEEFYTVANSVKNHLYNILNFFINRNTNANAESFNSKIKLFRANQRGVIDTKFFLFRLQKLFA